MSYKVNHASPMPLHAQVEELLRGLIEEPKFKEGGEFLPKEIELSKQLGVSRSTIRQAAGKLEYEGLIERKKGLGTRVAKKAVATGLAAWRSFTQEMCAKGVPFVNLDIQVKWVFRSERKKGLGTRVAKKAVATGLAAWRSFTQEMCAKGVPFVNLDIQVKWVFPKKSICDFLNVRQGTKVLKLSRLKGERVPVVYFESYFQPRIGLTGKEDFNRPLYDILENDYHSVPAISKEEIRASLAGGMAKLLRVKKSEPILVRERFVSDPGNRPLEYNIGFYRSDKFTYSIEIKN